MARKVEKNTREQPTRDEQGEKKEEIQTGETLLAQKIEAENLPKTSASVSKKTVRKKKKPSFLRDLFGLVFKIGFLLLVIFILFTYLFGVHRTTLPNMVPNIKDGDLVFFYRIDKDYVAGDALVLIQQGKQQVQRVIAVGGDEVDIDEEYIRVNGYIQLNLEDLHIAGRTMRYEEGIDFPVKLAEDEVFVLGDNRENATDSRIYGPVKITDTLGKVMMVIRNRGF